MKIKNRQENIRKEKEDKEIRRKKIEKLQEKWAINRWVSEYINQNKERWEKREKERKEKIIELEKDWEKMGRFEKIEYLKKKYKNKIPEKTLQQENPDQEQTWKVWKSPEKRQDKTNETQKNVRQEKTKKKYQQKYKKTTVPKKKKQKQNLYQKLNLQN